LVKDDSIYLLHIRDTVRRIFDYAVDGHENFLRETKTQDAVVRNLQVIGEAVRHMSQKLRTRHPDVPWRRIAGLSHKTIHEYFGVDPELVWEVVERELPGFQLKVEAILTGMTGRALAETGE
jgi:uncharacterized protein with HEPN domain